MHVHASLIAKGIIIRGMMDVKLALEIYVCIIAYPDQSHTRVFARMLGAFWADVVESKTRLKPEDA